jgi:hypothetical protein
VEFDESEGCIAPGGFPEDLKYYTLTRGEDKFYPNTFFLREGLKIDTF